MYILENVIKPFGLRHKNKFASSSWTEGLP